MFMDFVLVAADQIANQAAKLKYMFGGEAKVPLTITTTGGAGLSAAAQHSQSLEALFCHIPGIKVVCPSTPYDVKGLMSACDPRRQPHAVRAAQADARRAWRGARGALPGAARRRQRHAREAPT